MTDIVAAGDLARWLAQLVAAADRLTPLVVGQFRFAPHLDAARLSTFAAFAGARPDQIALELRKAG